MCALLQKPNHPFQGGKLLASGMYPARKGTGIELDAARSSTMSGNVLCEPSRGQVHESWSGVY